MGSNNKKKIQMSSGANAKSGKEGSIQKSQGGVKKSSKSTKIADRIYRNCVHYHRLKREILAPFITKLLIAKRFEDLTENLNSECSVFDPGMSTEVGNSTVRADFTLGMITEDNEDASEVSYQEDWRSE